MLSNNRIRVIGALVFSLVAHVALMGWDFRDDGRPVVGIVRQEVKVRLLARRVAVEKPEVVPAPPVREIRPDRAVVPPLPRPVEVAVREIPAVSLPAAPMVPELSDRAEDNPPVKQAPIGEGGESAQPAIIMARPLYRENPPPRYPDQARRRHLQGTVVLAVSVTSDGRVARIEISTGSGHDLLDRAALQAVKDWLFEPGQRAGRKVAMRVLVPVRFSLR
jgi:protein TonB